MPLEASPDFRLRLMDCWMSAYVQIYDPHGAGNLQRCIDERELTSRRMRFKMDERA